MVNGKEKIKCVVLCGGKGTRLFPATLHMQKSMLKVAGKPIILHIIEYWQRYTNDFVFVVHYKKDELINYIKTLPINAEFVEIDNVRGIAQGLSHARHVLPDKFIVTLGDCITKGEFEFPDKFDFGVGIWQTDDHYHIKSSYSVELDGDMIIKKVVEKPEKIINNFCGMGSYFFNKNIFDYIDKTPPSVLRNQIEITDAIQLAIDNGEKITGVNFKGHYININNKEDLGKAEKLFGDSF